jgi:hypothetical protein
MTLLIVGVRGRRWIGVGFVGGIFEAAVVSEAFTQDELDLPVKGAEIVVGPLAEGVQDVPVDAQQESLSFSHDALSRVFLSLY